MTIGRNILIAGCLGLFVSACTAGEDYMPRSSSALGVPEAYRHQPAEAASHIALAAWWTAFDDPVLSQLVERALRANTSIAVGQARLRAARAALRAERGTLWPSVTASASRSERVAVGSNPADSGNFQAGIDAAWEADLFGGRRRSIEAATADAEASAADLADVRRSVTAELALNYIDVRSLQARLATAHGNLAIQDDSLQIARWREQAGLVSGLDVEQAITLRAQTAASIPALEQSLDAASNRIAVLLGEAPGAVTGLLATAAPIPAAPGVIAPGLPAELLQRRPDVVAAERSLAAQVARIGVAKAELYPALRLAGTLSGNGTSLSEVADSLVGQIIGSITAPIFMGGQLRARVAQQRANADAAFASYRGTILVALEDAENALFAYDRAAARLGELERAEAAARTSLELARLRYTNGLSDFQALLDAQRSLLSISDNRVAARAALASAAVQLFKALGGGWPDPSPETRQ